MSFIDLGRWSTIRDATAYPESIRKKLDYYSFLPAYYRALAFLETVQANGFIDSAASDKIFSSHVKTWMLPNLQQRPCFQDL
jgi:hypothetical protein